MVSQTVEYALRAMGYIASLGGRAATSQTISRATRVPQAYLSKIMRDLVCAELVRSFRGPNGGFVLARAAEAIRLLDIVNAVEPARRVEWPATEDPVRRGLHRCLADAASHLEQTLRQTTLSAVIDPPSANGSHRATPEPLE